ncbi:MAG: hypothetical protein NC825_03800 [Candidatus Omnitrophica bacterium]|nr:hypothetical protein [Candidatus Omnitrophota bacterium]
MKTLEFYTVCLNPCLDVNCFVDSVKFDDIIRIRQKLVNAGGKGFNVARFLHKYKQKVIPLGLIAGYNGIRLKNLLLSCGIKNIDLLELSGETRESYNFFFRMVVS